MEKTNEEAEEERPFSTRDDGAVEATGVRSDDDGHDLCGRTVANRNKSTIQITLALSLSIS